MAGTQNLVVGDFADSSEAATSYMTGTDPAERRSGSFIVYPTLVVWVETSQGIQYFPSLHPEGRIAPGKGDNAISLIERRPTAIRVYVADAEYDTHFWYSASLVLRRGGREALEIEPFPSVMVSGMQADVFRDFDARDRDHSFHFGIPAEECVGTVDIEITVRGLPWAGVDVEEVPGGPTLREAEVYHLTGLGPDPIFRTARVRDDLVTTTTPVKRRLRFRTPPPFRIVAFPVRLRGSQPTEDDMRATFAVIEKTWPVPVPLDLEIRADAIAVDSDFPGTDDGSCWTGFTDLLDELDEKWTEELAQEWEIYVGVLPWQERAGAEIVGCGGGNAVAAAYAHDYATMAQEVGHAAGRDHSPGCGAGNVDPNFPGYPGVPPGAIGEVGIDVSSIYLEVDEAVTPLGGGEAQQWPRRAGTVGRDALDFMGYCAPFVYWISPYSYEQLMASIAAGVPSHRERGWTTGRGD